MITVTETKYIDGTGDIHKDVEYPKYDSYSLAADRGLIVYKSVGDNEKVKEEVYYVDGSFVKVRKS